MCSEILVRHGLQTVLTLLTMSEEKKIIHTHTLQCDISTACNNPACTFLFLTEFRENHSA